MATITIPDEKVVLIEAALGRWKAGTLARMDEVLLRGNLTEEQRTVLETQRAEIEAKGWRVWIWEMAVAQVKMVAQMRAKEAAEKKAQEDIRVAIASVDEGL